MRRPLSLVALGLLALGAQATVYKWVDEKGVTQYSESPPPDGKAKKVDIDSSRPPGSPTLTPQDWKQRDLEFRQRKIERERGEEELRQNSEQSAVQRRNRCLYAQHELNIVQMGRPVYHVNERGERVYMEDEERARAIEMRRKQVESYCDTR